MLCVSLLSLGSLIDLCPQFIITMTGLEKVILGCNCMVV